MIAQFKFHVQVEYESRILRTTNCPL